MRTTAIPTMSAGWDHCSPPGERCLSDLSVRWLPAELYWSKERVWYAVSAVAPGCEGAIFNAKTPNVVSKIGTEVSDGPTPVRGHVGDPHPGTEDGTPISENTKNVSTSEFARPIRRTRGPPPGPRTRTLHSVPVAGVACPAMHSALSGTHADSQATGTSDAATH